MNGRLLPCGGAKSVSTFAFAAGLRRRYATCATIMWPVSCHASALDCAETTSAQSRSALNRFFIRLLFINFMRETARALSSLVEQHARARAPELVEPRL